MLWLRWFTAFLDVATQFAPLSPQAQHIAHGWLDSIEKLVVNIVIIRASHRVRPLTLKPLIVERGGRRTPKGRAILGLRLRRALRAKDLRTRIAALSQDIGTLVDRVARRLPRGLTRLRGPRARASSAPNHARIGMGAGRLAAADTS
ncbi:MAG: hypothetical protein K2P58_14190 [Hyphomonadaceae bacterium]|nr:hypothetical protein [Hyphomonadaceae bacterium]